MAQTSLPINASFIVEETEARGKIHLPMPFHLQEALCNVPQAGFHEDLVLIQI